VLVRNACARSGLHTYTRLLPVSAIAHRLSKLVSLMAYGSTIVLLPKAGRESQYVPTDPL
jgi:hypothetical protein